MKEYLVFLCCSLVVLLAIALGAKFGYVTVYNPTYFWTIWLLFLAILVAGAVILFVISVVKLYNSLTSDDIVTSVFKNDKDWNTL